MGGYPKVPSERSVLGAEYTGAIPEEDLSFDTSAGHDHDGSNSKLLDTISNMLVRVAASEPTGLEGQIYYNSGDNHVWVATE